jgi:hypothetical protein
MAWRGCAPRASSNIANKRFPKTIAFEEDRPRFAKPVFFIFADSRIPLTLVNHIETIP